ncbi:MAG: glycoside hydrolase family 3 C-terminal domain-containing protein [Anaerolineae bacterium]|nr:glycoside hydrolase family 3 C-terminal domain-containing protein [Anaerolineae bacterium]
MPDSAFPFQNPDLPVAARVDDLVSRLTLEEKVSQMMSAAQAIPRLGIPEYDWWNECLHGVGRAGIATVFPQAIGLAAMWDVDLMHRIAVAISDEARAKHHEALRQGDRGRYKGLTFWTPNINIFRDPRWGRGQETYGEDPYLTARLGVAFVRGLQGDDPRYLKLVATPKHYAVHSGPEHARHEFDACVSARDLWDTYLPAFEACVCEGKAASVMGAYNRVNGEPCCASPTLLEEILRRQWGFDGYVVSDCGAIRDIYHGHKVVATAEEAAALAVRHGCDLNCGVTFSALVKAADQGLITEAEIDRSVRRLFTARMRLGMFDPPERVPYAQIPHSVNDCPQHRALALQAARESIVLLRNEGNLLPLARDLRAIAVIGPNADAEVVLLGNYQGTPSRAVTPLEGIRARAGSGTEVRYAPGCEVAGTAAAGVAEAVQAARGADVAILVLGLDQTQEGEEGQREGVPGEGPSQGDRVGLGLPGVQEELLRAVHATGTPVVLVLLNGSPIALAWAAAHVPAIVEAWYPGEEGGTAIAEVLWGDYNPAGRLPITFYRSDADLPPFADYAMAGRTYRYFSGEPLFPFGFGLSYASFAYTGLSVSPQEIARGESVTVRAEVRNTGHRAGDEVVQLYLRALEPGGPAPLRALAGFARLHLRPGEGRTVSFTIPPSQMARVDDSGRRVLEPGTFEVSVGGAQPGPGCAIGRFRMA